MSVQSGDDVGVSYRKVWRTIRAPPDFLGITQEAFGYAGEAHEEV
jgi:hypothetical protein